MIKWPSRNNPTIEKVEVTYFSYEKVVFTIQKAKSGRPKTLKLKVDGLKKK